MTEGENWLLNISDTETTVGCYGRRHLMYRDITQNKVRCTGTKNSGGRELARRPNSATPQTVGLMATACLHVITKASQTFPVLCT